MMIQLASTSPRREELLQREGIPYRLVETKAKEVMDPAFSPRVNAMASGWLKAWSACQLGAKGLILGCDTIVVCNGEILEKPKDRDDAKRMLCMLQGHTHEVISGFGLIDNENRINYVDSVISQVTVQKMTDEEIESLLDTGEHIGKSGSYMVQGRMRNYITGIEGSVDSIMGLPVAEILAAMKKIEVL